MRNLFIEKITAQFEYNGDHAARKLRENIERFRKFREPNHKIKRYFL